MRCFRLHQRAKDHFVMKKGAYSERSIYIEWAMLHLPIRSLGHSMLLCPRTYLLVVVSWTGTKWNKVSNTDCWKKNYTSWSMAKDLTCWGSTNRVRYDMEHSWCAKVRSSRRIGAPPPLLGRAKLAGLARREKGSDSEWWIICLSSPRSQAKWGLIP